VYIIFVPYLASHTPSLYPLPSHWCLLNPQTRPVLSSCSLFLKKKWHFYLFKISIQVVSLWHFHVYMYYNLNWFISSIFLLSNLFPFLCDFKRFENSIL
jgi:hypothetical protein